MNVTATTEGFAALAHQVWCERMQRAGWRYGPAYNETERTHDALVPFEKLPASDRRSTRAAILALEVEDLVFESIEYPRGPDREFTLSEMRVGLPVQCEPGPEIGKIVSWETDPGDEALRLIRVRWPDGSLSEHFPPERELRRLSLRFEG
ncbi:hypothetical protein PHYC_02004 [Phycisphaerales bacterium]|nr:hypothetical protein PHYC_02004 [Phycisphaerales bacterium]